MTRPWKATDVRPLVDDRVRFDHVARHLYQPGERWQQVIPGLGDARGRAWKAGCAPALLDTPNPDCDRVAPECRQHVLQDHEELLAPAYLSETRQAEADGCCGSLHKDGRAWAFVGPLGVFVIVRETGPRRVPEVKTAYRVRARSGSRPEDFYEAAVRKLRDKSSYRGGG